MLDAQQIAHVAVELDATLVTRMRSVDAPVYLGDASRPAMLEKMRLKEAVALAVCTDDPEATERVLAAARRVAPEVPVVARARDGAHAMSLLEQGAAQVVPEVLESGLQLGHVLLEELGLPVHVVRDLIEARRVESMHALRGAEGS